VLVLLLGKVGGVALGGDGRLGYVGLPSGCWSGAGGCRCRRLAVVGTRACLQTTTIGGLPLLPTSHDSWLLASHTWWPDAETASAG
jgi:hypothetical protein